MKLENIKTRTEFYEFADIWYQRVHRLREVWQDENEPTERKEKALMLWTIMYKRVMALFQMSIKINQQKLPRNFEQGGRASGLI